MKISSKLGCTLLPKTLIYVRVSRLDKAVNKARHCLLQADNYFLDIRLLINDLNLMKTKDN